MRTRVVIATAMLLSIVGACDSVTVPGVYYRGERVAFGVGDSVFVDGDGRFDARTRRQYVCTRDVPTSACVESFVLSFQDDFAVLTYRESGPAVPLGTEIGEQPDLPTSEDEYWHSSGVGLGNVRIDLLNDTSWVSPNPFNDVDGALVGIRVGRGDSSRFGWIRIASTVTLSESLQGYSAFAGELIEVFVKEDGNPAIAGIPR